MKKTGKAKSSVKPGARSKGDKYMCASCGLVVTVDRNCGCADACELVCCGQPMRLKK